MTIRRNILWCLAMAMAIHPASHSNAADAPAATPSTAPATRPITRPATAPSAPVVLPVIKGFSREPVLAMAWDDKSRVMAVARPGIVEVWSLDTRDLLDRFTGLNGNVEAVAFDSGGRRLFAAGGEAGAKGRIWVWQVKDWKRVTTFDAHADSISSIAVSPDGQTFATGSYDHKIILWDVQTLKPKRELNEHRAAVMALSFRPDGRRLASGSADRTIKIWDLACGLCCETRTESEQTINALAWSPEGERLAAGGDDRRLRVWNVPAAGRGLELESSPVTVGGAILNLAWSPDGTLIAAAADDGSIVRWAAADMMRKDALPGSSDWPPALIYAKQIIAVGRMDGSVSFFDVQNARELKSLRSVHESTGSPVVAEPVHTLRRIDLPATLAGTFVPANVERYVFDARKDQHITIDVEARRIGSRSRVHISLYDGAGALRASAGPTPTDADPLLAFTAPSDGRYAVKLVDLTGSTAVDNSYRMTIGAYAYATGIFPLAIPANTATRVQLLGQNLPADRWVVIKASAEGEVDVPLDPARFLVRRPMRVLVSSSPDLIRAPDEKPRDAMAIEPPVSVSARILSPGEAHLYRFEAHGGRAYVIETAAARRGSPMDARIQVLHADGHPVGEKPAGSGLSNSVPNGENDGAADRELTSDARLLFTAPADAEYIVRVTDSRGFGGDDYAYRLTVRPANPDFTATIEGFTPDVPTRAGREFLVRVRRTDGFEGPVKINFTGVPKGFSTYSMLTVDAGSDHTYGTFYAAPGALTTDPARDPIRVTATVTIDGRAIRRSLPSLRPPFSTATAPVFVSADSVIVAPGQSATAIVNLEKGNQNPKGLTLELRSLPRGIVMADPGAPIVLTGNAPARINLRAAGWLAEGDLECHLAIRDYPGLTTAPLVIHVRKNQPEHAP